MATAANTPALLALFLGIYYLAAALGGMANSGLWERLVGEMEASAYGQFLGGVMAMLIGSVLLALVAPRGDWLNLVLFTFGCLAMLEGVLFLIIPRPMLSFFRPLIHRAARPFALLAAAFGAFLLVAGLTRL